MSVHIIIDGYNFIRQSMSSRLLNSRDLQEEREIFIDSLAAYKRRKAHAITVVFDGTRAPFDLARKEVVRGIEILFSPAGQTADTVIKQLAAREREKALVVSSDREISDFAEARGATVISSADFENRLYLLSENVGEAGLEDDEYSVPSTTTRKKGPSFRLSKKQRNAQKKISKL